MDIRWIEDFLSVASSRSFSRAAEERHISQPSLSRHIQALEHWVGVPLIERRGLPLTLTPEGVLFRDNAEHFLRRLLETRSMLRGEVNPDAHSLRVIAGHSLSVNFVPSWLQTVRQDYSDISVRAVTASINKAIKALSDGSADLLLCYHHTELPVLLDETRYAFLPLGDTVLMPVSAPGLDGRPRYALPGTRQVPVPLISFATGAYLRRAVQYLLDHAGQPYALLRRYESDMSDQAKELVLQGLGMAWLPEMVVSQELAEGRLVRAGGQRWQLPLGIRLYCDLNNRKPALVRLWQHLSGRDLPD